MQATPIQDEVSDSGNIRESGLVDAYESLSNANYTLGVESHRVLDSEVRDFQSRSDCTFHTSYLCRAREEVLNRWEFAQGKTMLHGPTHDDKNTLYPR